MEPQSPQEVFRHRLARLRKALGYTSQGSLTKRVAEVGGGLGETSIARIEAGDRNVRLDEALMLAAALDVSPLALLIPEEGELRLAHGIVVDADHARRWLMGKEPLDPANQRSYRYVSPKPTLDVSQPSPLDLDAGLDRRNVSVVPHKRHARHRLAVLIGALYELEARRWHAAGPERDMRELRRQARELAAHLDCPCEPDDA